MTRGLLRNTFAGLLIGGIALAGGLAGSGIVNNAVFARQVRDVDVSRQSLATVNDLAAVFKAVGKAVEPSVVHIRVRKTVANPYAGLNIDPDMFRRAVPNAPSLPDTLEQQGLGSGVIIEARDGYAYILTNNHVAGGASELDITLADGREVNNGKLVGADAKSDLAVIRVKLDRVIPAKWGDSSQLEKGDWIMAFGSPFGYVGSMTHGIVSALDRQVGILGQMGVENFIQVDAPINPGNSGGPLVNLRGEIVGINTAIASRTGGFQGIGFAIPSNQAKGVYEQLRDGGKVTRGWLGVGIINVSDAAVREAAAATGFKGDTGVFVQSTMKGTPAAGKLLAGDVITAINGKPVAGVAPLRAAIADTKPGTEVKLAVVRDGKPIDVAITIGEQPDEPMAVAETEPGTARIAPKVDASRALGVTLRDVSKPLTLKHGLDADASGAIVTEVAPGSLPARMGVREGDLITRIDGNPVASAADAAKALSAADLEKGVRLQVVNREGSSFLFLREKK